MGVQPVFLFSLPRSGSTLLQRMLAGHSRISTVSEPWLLLPQLYALRPEGAYTEYGHRLAVNALEDFCRHLPGGRATYLSEIRALALKLYAMAAEPDAAYFVDKTPRYHLVAGQIMELFPEGRFVFLWRNPLAVVASVVDTWAGGRWRPYLYKVDLFSGLAALVELYQQQGSRAVALRYEDLVLEPEATVSGVLSYLGLPWQGSVISGATAVLSGRMGDPTAGNYAGVSAAPIERWRTSLATPVRRRWCRRYLRWIGRERLAVMGYQLDGLLAELESLPSRLSPLGSDLYLTAKAAAWSVAEPTINREKLSRLPQWHRIHSHH